jgi:hypothetical protein
MRMLFSRVGLRVQEHVQGSKNTNVDIIDHVGEVSAAGLNGAMDRMVLHSEGHRVGGSKVQVAFTDMKTRRTHLPM